MREGVTGIKNNRFSIFIFFKNREVAERILEPITDFSKYFEDLPEDDIFSFDNCHMYCIDGKKRFIVILNKTGNWEQHMKKMIGIEND